MVADSRRSTGRPHLAAAAGALVLVLYAVVVGLGTLPYDDSLFFKRFALNALQHGVLAWNLEDGPVFGCTSQLYLGVVVALTAAFAGHVIVASQVFAGCCLGAVAVVLARAGGRAPSPSRATGVAIFVVSMPPVLTTVCSGMETALALAVLAWSLGSWLKDGGPLRHSARAGLLVTAVFAVRPDAAIIPIVGVVVYALGERRIPFRFSVSVVLSLGAFVGLCWGYYGTALPLSFYMKTTALGGYGPALAQMGATEKWVNLWTLGLFATPLAWLASGRRDALNWALMAGALAFFGYHAVATTEVMGYRARFYVPGVVPLALAAARAGAGPFRWSGTLFVSIFVATTAAAYGSGWTATADLGPLASVPWYGYLAACGCAALWVLPIQGRARVGAVFVACAAAVVAWQLPRPPRVSSDVAIVQSMHRSVTSTRGLPTLVRCVPELNTVYHTEMGALGAMLPDARLVDLAGILSTQTGVHAVDFDTLCSTDRPEAIFLPHRNYARLVDRVLSSACLEGYESVVSESSSPLWVRTDLVPRFRRCRASR